LCHVRGLFFFASYQHQVFTAAAAVVVTTVAGGHTVKHSHHCQHRQRETIVGIAHACVVSWSALLLLLLLLAGGLCALVKAWVEKTALNDGREKNTK